MAILPVNPDEAPAFEARLGIRLPESYMARLSDPALQQRLAAPGVGMLQPGLRMADFAALSEQLRAEQPEFPCDGVVVFCGVDGRNGFNLQWGYLKFLRPDAKDPKRLDDMLFSWDLRARRLRRDCRVTRFLDGVMAVTDENLTRHPRDAKGPVIESAAPTLLALMQSREPRVMLNDDWLPCFHYPVIGHYLSPCDLGQTPGVDNAVRITPGLYDVLVRLGRSRLGDWPVVSAVRILQATGIPDESVPVFKLDIDLAATAIYDRQAFFKAVRTDDRDSFAMDLAEIQKSPCLVHAGQSRVAIIPSGDGDGTYPVFALKQDGRTIGLEISFQHTG